MSQETQEPVFLGEAQAEGAMRMLEIFLLYLSQQDPDRQWSMGDLIEIIDAWRNSVLLFPPRFREQWDQREQD